MGVSTLWVPARLPGLNELLDARATTRKVGRKTVWTLYTTLKTQWQRDIGLLVRAQGFEPVGTRFTYLFLEKDRRRDRTNIVAGGVKLLEDTMVDLGLIRNDGWRYVEDFRAHVDVGESPGVMVAVGPEILTKAQMMKLRERRYASGTRQRDAGNQRDSTRAGSAPDGESA